MQREPARTRDYSAEYARRIAKGLERGLTRAQARGHPGTGQRLVSRTVPATSYDKQLEAGVKQIRQGDSLTKSAKSIGVSGERLKAYVENQKIGAKVGGRWQVTKDTRVREMLMFSQGQALTIRVRGYENSKRIGEYMAAVGRFLETNDDSHLRPFAGKAVRDSGGNRHPFETDPNSLYRLAQGGADDFSRIYRIP